MAIAFDSVTHGTNNATTTLTISSVPVASVANRIIVVRILLFNDVTRLVASVTFAGSQSFTFLRRDDSTPGGGMNFNWRSEIWYLVNPTVTTGNIVVTFNSAISSVGLATALVYNGVDQTTPIVNSNYAGSPSGTTINVACTTSLGNRLVAMFTATTGANAGSYTTGTERYNANSNNRRIVGGDQASSATSTTATFTATTSDDKVGHVLQLILAGAAVGGSPHYNYARRRAA